MSLIKEIIGTRVMLLSITIFVVGMLFNYMYIINYFKDPPFVSAPLPDKSYIYNVVYLSSIIHAEANTKDKGDMYLVGSTVLNRVDDERFPSTIYEVISDKGQYDGFMTKRFKRSPVTDYIAIDLLSGLGRESCVLYFYNPRTATDRKFIYKMNNEHIKADESSSHVFFGDKY